MIASGISFPALMCASATAASEGETQLPAENEGNHVADALEGHVQELRARGLSSMRMPR